ncbi:cytochrome c-type biogenesis protein CcmH [SAR92 clade bacterium H921]|jgi:cytochrome c-type biogenesis protein CcmH|nr:cytochrome c-type biogenesis protein CcmH [SAR92 clade bacterium H921]MDG0971356.1 cytochrome c-type biogenesis protein CcmH [Porticoccaceae bacterium]MDG1308603.1 cytochrome c-type biogenesis protein CcmH [Porticoccaceae bacterium]
MTALAPMTLCLLILSFSPLTFAVAEIVEFSDESLRPRYQQLVEELRCPKCQNQNLADSNSPISQDLRREIQRLLEQQMTDQQIKDYLKTRYSEFILYRPEVNKNTWLLWGSPIAVVLVGLLIVVRHNRRVKPSLTRHVPVDSRDQQRLAAMLRDEENQR